MSTLSEEYENEHKRLFGNSTENGLEQIKSVLLSSGSAGNNPVELAKLLTTLQSIINIFGWEKKPLQKMVDTITNYQASVDTKYHNDLKDVLIALEIERRREQRKGLSILQQ